ncbi:MAG: hypothetical protein NZZ41_06725 [Candidatus Dojkabacteria bacterium]|nr:hypothetical protein [Candidatus Dojkabacteria bacterium]
MIITGIALPKNAVYNNNVIFDSQTKVMYASTVPLLKDHVLENVIGKVLDFYVDAEGNLRYVAKVENEESIECDQNKCEIGASIGAKWQQIGDSNTLFIYELSLTESPHFIETLNAKYVELQKNKNVSIINNMNISAQSEQEILALVERVSQIESEIASMKQIVTSLEERIAGIEQSLEMIKTMSTELQQSISASKNINDDIMKLADKYLSDFVNVSLKPIVSELTKINKI